MVPAATFNRVAVALLRKDAFKGRNSLYNRHINEDAGYKESGDALKGRRNTVDPAPAAAPFERLSVVSPIPSIP